MVRPYRSRTGPEQRVVQGMAVPECQDVHELVVEGGGWKTPPRTDRGHGDGRKSSPQEEALTRGSGLSGLSDAGICTHQHASAAGGAVDDVVVADVAPDGADGQWAGGEEGTAAGRRGTRTDRSGSALAVRLRASVPSSMARTQIRRQVRTATSTAHQAPCHGCLNRRGCLNRGGLP